MVRHQFLQKLGGCTSGATLKFTPDGGIMMLALVFGFYSYTLRSGEKSESRN